VYSVWGGVKSAASSVYNAIKPLASTAVNALAPKAAQAAASALGVDKLLGLGGGRMKRMRGAGFDMDERKYGGMAMCGSGLIDDDMTAGQARKRQMRGSGFEFARPMLSLEAPVEADEKPDDEMSLPFPSSSSVDEAPKRRPLLGLW